MLTSNNLWRDGGEDLPKPVAGSASPMDTETLIRIIHAPFASELPDIGNAANAHCAGLPRKGLTTEGSTSTEDCLVL
jgi:hypothetical protein